MAVVCPECGEKDRIIKVSGVLHRDTHTGTFTDDEGFPRQFAIRSEISQLLEIPAPQYKSTTVLMFWVVGIYVAMMALGALFTASRGGTPFFVCFAAFLGVPALVIWLYGRTDLAKRQRIWAAPFQLWERLYYCERDNIVFNPENGAATRPEWLVKYLESETGVNVNKIQYGKY